MSHTRKDEPYDVRAKKSGQIEHNHDNGSCVIGSYKERWKNIRSKNQHRRAGDCAKIVSYKVCMHDKRREELQQKIDTARSSNNAMFTHNLCEHKSWEERSFCEDAYFMRRPSSSAIQAMVGEGYFPNCDEQKTHEIDIREYDMKLLLGEELGRSRGENNLLSPIYDKSIPCKGCDEIPEITCFYSIPYYKFKKMRYYDYWDDDIEDSPTDLRAELGNLAKKYSTR